MVSPLITSTSGVTLTVTEARHTVKKREKRQKKNYIRDSNDGYFTGQLDLVLVGRIEGWIGDCEQLNDLADGFSLQPPQSHTQ